MNQHRAAPVVVFASKLKESHERFDLEERHRRIDDVQEEIVRVAKNKVVRVLRREASFVPNCSLMAGGFTSVHYCQVGRPLLATGFVADVHPVMDFDYLPLLSTG